MDCIGGRTLTQAARRSDHQTTREGVGIPVRGKRSEDDDSLRQDDPPRTSLVVRDEVRRLMLRAKVGTNRRSDMSFSQPQLFSATGGASVSPDEVLGGLADFTWKGRRTRITAHATGGVSVRLSHERDLDQSSACREQPARDLVSGLFQAAAAGVLHRSADQSGRHRLRSLCRTRYDLARSGPPRPRARGL